MHLLQLFNKFSVRSVKEEHRVIIKFSTKFAYQIHLTFAKKLILTSKSHYFNDSF